MEARGSSRAETRWRSQLAALASRNLRRSLQTLSSSCGPTVKRAGQTLLNLASNNYLGLADHPQLRNAAIAALTDYGIGAGASRLICGDLQPHRALEQSLAALKETESALVYSSGYAANVGVLSAIIGPHDQVFADALNHASLIDGCRLSRAAVQSYAHADLEDLEQRLKAAPPRALRFVVTDGVFSMDADLAPLPGLVELCERYEAVLIVDDAHATGVVGPQGRGTAHHFGLAGRVPVQLATLSKALAVQGGAVTGSATLIELLLHRSRSFVYSTGIAPVLAGAALAAVALVAGPEGEARRARLQGHLSQLSSGLQAKGYRVQYQPPAPMLMVLIGEAAAAVELSALLAARSILAPAIRPPTVPAGTSRIRLAPMATHTDEDIARVLAAFPPAEVRR